MTRTVIFQQNGMNNTIFSVEKELESAKKTIRNIYVSDLEEYCRHRAVIGVYELENFRIFSGQKHMNQIMAELNGKMTKDRLIQNGGKVYGFDLSYMTDPEKDTFLDYCGKTIYKIKEVELIDE